MKTTRLDEKLWVGPYSDIPEIVPRLILDGKEGLCVVSIIPIGSLGYFKADALHEWGAIDSHRILFAWDDSVVRPEAIDEAVASELPTFIHCNSGQNRSSMLATCWILRHSTGTPAQRLSMDDDVVRGILSRVLKAREKDLGCAPIFHAEMENNVLRYAEYLRQKSRRVVLEGK